MYAFVEAAGSTSVKTMLPGTTPTTTAPSIFATREVGAAIRRSMMPPMVVMPLLQPMTTGTALGCIKERRQTKIVDW